MPAFAVRAFKQCGFLWGGDFTRRKDPMHFEAIPAEFSKKPAD